MRKNISRENGLSWWIGGLFFIIFSMVYWLRVAQQGWSYVGDSLFNVVLNAFQVSGFYRGEYPLWNPLIRCGQNEATLQIFLANPITSAVNFLSVLVHNKDMVMVFATGIYVMISLYAVGMALLVTTFSRNFNTAVFVFIVTLSSSTVYFSTYHCTFILMVFALPLMVYGIIRYFSEFKLLYLFIFLSAMCCYIYAYEIPMGIIAVFVLCCAGSIVYHKEVPGLLRRIKKIPPAHAILAVGLFFLFALPMFYMFYEYRTDLLAISRLSHISMNDRYELSYVLDFFKNTFSPLTSKKFWPAVLTGFTCDNYHLLRHYLIPVAAPFLVIAVIVLSRPVLLLLLTAVGVSFFSANLFPASVFLRLPGFNSIHNLHFFVQYVLLTFILLAGLGFDWVSKQWSVSLKKTMNGVISAYLCFCLVLSFFIHMFPGFEGQNIFAIGSSIIVGLLLLFVINIVSDRRRDQAILILAAVMALSAFWMMNSIIVIGGGKTQNKVLLSLRHRTDHSLKFLYERPDSVRALDVSVYPASWEEDMGTAEDFSLLSLQDNSYAQGRGNSLSLYPYMKSNYLFLMLPGHEVLARQKFLFFERAFNSQDPADMMAFKQEPGLFKKMVDKSIGLVSGPSESQGSFAMGDFHPELIEQQPPARTSGLYSVEVKEYKANSIKLMVNVARPGLLTYTDAWDKSWRVSVDGKEEPLQRVFFTFKGVMLSQGIHEVNFVYKNPIIDSILLMNIIFWLCVGFILFDRLKALWIWFTAKKSLVG